MNNSLFRVCLILSTHTILRTSKSIGNNTMKKCYSLLRAGPAYYRMCSTDVYCSKQTGSSSTKGNHHPSFLLLLNWAEEKLSMQPKFVAAWNNEQKPQTSVNGLARFYYFRHLYQGSAAVLLTIIAWVAHRYGQLYLHCSLIYFWVPSSCFCIVISLSLRVKHPFSGNLRQSGRLHYHAGGGALTHWSDDCFDVQPTTTSGNIITQSIIFSFSIS